MKTAGALTVLLFTLVLVSSALASPRTLLVASTPIRAFAQDNDRIAWVDGRGCPAVKLRGARGGSTAAIGRIRGPANFSCDLERITLVLGGRRALWTAFENCCNNGYGYVVTGAPGERPKVLDQLYEALHLFGDSIVGAAGDGTTLAYGTANVDLTNGDPCWFSDDGAGCCLFDSSVACEYAVIAGGVKRVIGRSRIRVPEAPRPAVVAVAAGRVAIAPADLGISASPAPHAVVGAPVEIRNAVTGALISSFSPTGQVSSLALTAAHAVAHASDSTGANWIEWHSTLTGGLLGTSPVAGRVRDLDVAGGQIVYRVGKSIRLIDTATGRDRLLTTRPVIPIGVSLEGRRVAWAENRGGQGFVRAVILPR